MPNPEPLAGDPDWYRRAVLYEVLVGTFADANHDGTGDLPGLVSTLDYLGWLGIDCLWLPPFYPSPMRDSGYDISDFRSVRPEYGSVEDFTHLLEEAHRRGIRVITDLVLNHTSDEHPWFQRSRTDPNGPFGDFYVWSDTDDRYTGARVLFADTETSNWTFDPVRHQYFWHRFFSHQPDLNYDNPAVQDAMLEVLRFWLDLGVDGVRLDTVPYLFERDGTACENLAETHDFLKMVRKVVDDEYPGRILLAEANQEPKEAAGYFGDHTVGGDECQVTFRSPLMPRILLALRQESRLPVSEILSTTPDIPSGCQWGLFLRNHDELSLGTLTGPERASLHREYAPDPRMLANTGIRRRLAPLLDNDRNQQELLTALLLSLPGSPVLYYGDEIGMGDNIWLPDRDGMRTPMQWSPDRNAGFSRCDPGKLIRPVIANAIYGYQSVNVEAQQASPMSLLHWTRTMIATRREHPAFSVGDFTELTVSNPAGLAYTRELDGETILCVFNFSRFPQPVGVELPGHDGSTPVELTGQIRFPPIHGGHFQITLPGHGFYWFRLGDDT